MREISPTNPGHIHAFMRVVVEARKTNSTDLVVAISRAVLVVSSVMLTETERVRQSLLNQSTPSNKKVNG